MKVMMMMIVVVVTVTVATNITEGITPQGGLSQQTPGGGVITVGKKTQFPLAALVLSTPSVALIG